MRRNVVSTIMVEFTVAAVAWSVFAHPAVRPVLPLVNHVDTETVTNVPFVAWERRLREFRFDLEFFGTASNNVEMAFGTDVNGDGVLSDGEVDIVTGWDCGEMFISNNAADERMIETSADGTNVFSCVCEMRPDGRIVNIACTNNGTSVFLDLFSAKPSWFYSSDWNMVRLLGRGENVRSGERFSVKTTPSGFLFRFR